MPNNNNYNHNNLLFIYPIFGEFSFQGRLLIATLWNQKIRANAKTQKALKVVLGGGKGSFFYTTKCKYPKQKCTKAGYI